MWLVYNDFAPNKDLHALYPDDPINNEISDEYEKNPEFSGLEDLQNLLKDELKKIMPTAINSANGIGKNKLIIGRVLIKDIPDGGQENLTWTVF